MSLSSPLYDERRNRVHQPSFLMDLIYNGTDDHPDRPISKQIDQNLMIICHGFRRQEARAVLRAALSPGRRARPRPGQPRERAARHHPPLDRRPARGIRMAIEDMSNFYLAARDPAGLLRAPRAVVSRQPRADAGADEARILVVEEEGGVGEVGVAAATAAEAVSSTCQMRSTFAVVHDGRDAVRVGQVDLRTGPSRCAARGTCVPGRIGPSG
ncbi:hypothetical protein EJB05_39706, partial [Eragrostis curvula]